MCRGCTSFTCFSPDRGSANEKSVISTFYSAPVRFLTPPQTDRQANSSVQGCQAGCFAELCGGDEQHGMSRLSFARASTALPGGHGVNATADADAAFAEPPSGNTPLPSTIRSNGSSGREQSLEFRALLGVFASWLSWLLCAGFSQAGCASWAATSQLSSKRSFPLPLLMLCFLGAAQGVKPPSLPPPSPFPPPPPPPSPPPPPPPSPPPPSRTASGQASSRRGYWWWAHRLATHRGSARPRYWGRLRCTTRSGSSFG